ncbi:ECF transporter S component [Clostridium tyrobutyricum]|uniref:ECF transporter S component n=1 Tax=Clostridium tyrobutyricum TaxID=1519 RepID=UPI000305826A|nr:ECF transporter S component [Clostridium tyrobutyricum]MEA5009766.1 ECF transporter S component [Clostridium tyrobutyricum]
MSIYKIDKKITKIKGKITTKKLVMIGMFGAISTILMLFEFPIPFTPTFVKMDLSELPIILGGFMMGPLAGFLIIVIKIGLHLVLKGTTTMGVGELANMIGSATYMLPAVLLYRKLKTRSSVALALILGTIVTSVGSIFENMYLIFPVYSKLYGMPIKAIIAMGTTTNPYVTNMFTLMCFSLFPFNLVKYSVVSIITFVAFKKLGFVRRNLIK